MTSLLMVKLRRDLRANWTRLLSMVIAVAVSLTAFGGALCAWAAIRRETISAYLSTEPASATIVLDRAIDAEQMAAIAALARSRPGVIEATGRSQFTSHLEVNGRLRNISLQVFVVAPDERMRLARFFVQQGSWPPAPGEIFIRRDSLPLLGVAVGDMVTIKTPSGKATRLRVAGIVYDPSLAPAPQHQQGNAYLTTASLVDSGWRPVLDQLKIQIADPGQATPSRDRDVVVAVAGDVGMWLQRAYGLAIREIQVPTPYAHPHQGQADAVLLSLLGGAAATLLLSTILVATMLNGLFAQQIPQIGIMKAIGARSGHIGRLCLMMTLLVAVAATLLALAPALLIGRAGASIILGFLGIQATSLAAPWWTHLVILATGLSLPPVMALVPLVKTSLTTVRAAIDHCGLGSNSSTAMGVIDRLSRLHFLDRSLLMALRNTMRRPARFVLSTGLLASAGTVFVSGMSLSSGVKAIDQERREQRNWDVDVQLASPALVGDVTAMVARVPGVRRVEGWSRVPCGVAGPGKIPLTRTYPDQGHGRVWLNAVPAGATSLSLPKVLEGRWLKPGETGAVVLNQITRLHTVPGVHAGDTVQLFVGGIPTTWRVVGIVEERGGHRGGVYTTAEGFAEAQRQSLRVNELRIATDSHDEPARTTVAYAVERTLVDAGIEVQSAASVSRSDAISAGHLGPVITILLGIALPLGVIGGIGLASTMSTNILDRTREFGVMRAVGARTSMVRRVVIAEGVFLALASCVVATLPTLALTAVLGTGLGNLFMYARLPFRISLLAAGIWVMLVVLIALLATEAAATHASRITVRKALAYV